MNANVFLDTNTLICLLQGRAPAPGTILTGHEVEANRRRDITLRLLDSPTAYVGIQTLNEVCNVSARNHFNWEKTRHMLDTFESLCAGVIPLTLGVHKRGLFLYKRYRLQFYDALMLAAALEANCQTFYSEDMQHGQIIERRMTISNPFRK